MIIRISFITILFFLLLCGFVYAEEIDIDIIIQIESGGNPYAHNHKSGARGLLQVTPIVLEEFNKKFEGYFDGWTKVFKATEANCIQQVDSDGELFGSKYYRFQRIDLFNEEINLLIGGWYLNRIKTHYLPHYKIPVTIENILASYNWGIGNVVKWHKKGGEFKNLPCETQQYIKKYNKGGDSID